MRVATNRAGILLAIMRPGQLKGEYKKVKAKVKEPYLKDRIRGHILN